MPQHPGEGNNTVMKRENHTHLCFTGNIGTTEGDFLSLFKRNASLLYIENADFLFSSPFFFLMSASLCCISFLAFKVYSKNKND